MSWVQKALRWDAELSSVVMVVVEVEKTVFCFDGQYEKENIVEEIE